MNRRRNESRTSGFPIFALLIAAAIMAAGGVLHVYYKNGQIQVCREIDAIDRRVEQYRLDIRTTEMRMDQLLNRFVIRQQLEENGSVAAADIRRGCRRNQSRPRRHGGASPPPLPRAC